jgi:hypothetical protein
MLAGGDGARALEKADARREKMRMRMRRGRMGMKTPKMKMKVLRAKGEIDDDDDDAMEMKTPKMKVLRAKGESDDDDDDGKEKVESDVVAAAAIADSLLESVDPLLEATPVFAAAFDAAGYHRVAAVADGSAVV